jgi:hypothetical protein
MLERSRSAAAIRARERRARRREQHRVRQARFRRRQADGLVLVETALTPAETAKLLAYRFLLSESELEDKVALAEALHALIQRLA